MGPNGNSFEAISKSKGDICDKIGRVMKANDSSAMPVIDVIEGSPTTGVPSSSCDNDSVLVTTDIYRKSSFPDPKLVCNSDINDEIEDLMEERLLLRKIKCMENFRRHMVNFRDPELENVDYRIKPKLENNHENKDENVVSKSAEDDVDDDNDNSLLDCFMDTDTKTFFETQSAKENLHRVSVALTKNLLMQSDLTSLQSTLMERLREVKKELICVRSDISKFRQETKCNIITNEKKFMKACRYLSFGRPYFKDEGRYCCPKNEDSIKMRQKNQLLSINLYPSRPWKLKEKFRLEEGVKKILVEEFTEDFRKKEKIIKQRLEEACSVAEKKVIKLELESLISDINCVEKKNLAELFSKCDPDHEFDWLRISAKDIPKHTSEECRRMWHLYVKPTVNKKRFSKDEDNNLVQLVERYGEQNWDTVAKCLRTSRTEFLCFVNYQRRLSKGSNKTGKWTEEEDNKLINLVKEHSVGDYISWPKIAYYFQGRTLSQLYTRWHNCINPNLKKGRFNKSEDKLITSYVRKHGENFRKIAKLLKYRNSVQIRERYFRKKLVTAKNIGRFSLEEDELLLSLVNKYGVSRWSLISKQFITRTRTQIRHRYGAIKNFFLKYPNLTVNDIHRGPKARSQFLIPEMTPEVKVTSQEQESKMLSELISENKKLLRMELLKVRKGRKPSVKRSRLDLKLIDFFKEVFSSDKLKLRTNYVIPDVTKAANALALICSLLKTSLVLSGDEFNEAIKGLPVTLKKVILRMIDEENGFSSFRAKTDDCKLFSISSSQSVVVSSDTSSIDCLPIDPKETLVGDFYYLLSELKEDDEMMKFIDEKPCVEVKTPKFIPYFLPPNIITMIGCRSIFLTKGKISHCLARGISSGYINVNDSEFMKKSGLKLFSGYFSEDECQLVNPEKLSDDSVDVEIIQKDAFQISKATITLASAKKSGIISSIDSNYQTEESFISQPSTSDGSGSVVTSLSTSLFCDPVSIEDHSSNEDESQNDSFSRKIIPSIRTKRLTKQEAIDLWKERLMVLFGWPIVLSNQPPIFCKDEKEEIIEEVNESNGIKRETTGAFSNLQAPIKTTVVEENNCELDRLLLRNIAIEGDSRNRRSLNCEKNKNLVESIGRKEKVSDFADAGHSSKRNAALTKRKNSTSENSEESKILSEVILEKNSLTEESVVTASGRPKRKRQTNKLFTDYKIYK